MPTRTDRETPRYDATVQRSVKNVYDRHPVLIPQLFVDTTPRWYQQWWGIALGVVAFLIVVGVAFAVQEFGLAGTAQRAGEAGVGLMRGFARVVG
ncbi:MAG TPA: hypothetical protein VFS59_00395 [Gemmatimonadaceae bacterium]|nr:hypothetical protein [Gemmatimonadaceae bacterium]